MRNLLVPSLVSVVNPEEGPPLPELSPGTWKPLALWLLLWAALFFGCSALSPYFPAWSDSVGKFLSAMILIVLSFGLISGFSSLRFHRNGYLVIGVLGLILVSRTAGDFVQRTSVSHQIAHITGKALFWTADSLYPSLSHALPTMESRNALYLELTDQVKSLYPTSGVRVFFLCLSQLVLAAGIGLWIGTGIDSVSHLLPIALVAGIADIWSVSAGATSVIIQSSTIHYFLLRFPLIGGKEFYYPLLIGLTDFLFFGIFFQAVRRFGLGLWKNVLLLGLSFFTAVAAALFLSVGLPVLPFMAICFLGGNYRRLTMTREELVQMMGFLLGIGIIGLIVTKILHH